MGVITADVFKGLAEGMGGLARSIDAGMVVRGKFVVDVHGEDGVAYPFLMEWQEDLGEYGVVRPANLEELDMVTKSEGLDFKKEARLENTVQDLRAELMVFKGREYEREMDAKGKLEERARQANEMVTDEYLNELRLKLRSTTDEALANPVDDDEDEDEYYPNGCGDPYCCG